MEIFKHGFTRRIYFWPDGDWCEEDELGGYSWKSDDYTPEDIPAGWTDEEIDKWVGFQTRGLS